LLQARAEAPDLGFEIGSDVFALPEEIKKGIDVGGETENFFVVADRFFQPLAILEDLLAS